MRNLTLVCVAVWIIGCAGFQRHPHSGYAFMDESPSPSVNNFYSERADANEASAREEIGLSPTKELSENEAIALQNHLTLKRLENRLANDSERRQYYFYKPMMKSASERIQFLSIPTFDGRERWAQSRNLSAAYNNFDDATLSLIESNDIAVGMNPQAVKESWGDPDTVDIAGNEIYGNQAWRYTKMVSGEEGYHQEVRIIYFENGRVVGWESL